MQLPLTLAVGKLRAGPIPFETTSDSSLGEACTDSLIAAGRALSDEASEHRDTQGHVDQAARDLDSDSQQDASSVEGRETAHADRDSHAAAGRAPSDEASEHRDTQGQADQAARDPDSESQQDASSVEGRVTAHADRDSHAAASVNQGARSKAGALSDEQTGEQAVGWTRSTPFRRPA